MIKISQKGWKIQMLGEGVADGRNGVGGVALRSGQPAEAAGMPCFPVVSSFCRPANGRERYQ